MNISNKRKLYVVVGTVVMSLLVTVTTVLGPPRAALATTAAPGRVERVSARQNSYNFVVDHYLTDASGIPESWLDQGRALDTFFAHMSVGDNIMDGMADLQVQNPARYTIAVGSGGASWFTSNDGILEQALGDNYRPLLKVDTFDGFIRGGYYVADLAMMKFCPGDLRPDFVQPPGTSGQQIWDAYRPMMEALIDDYPDVTFVWWTFPLASASSGSGNDEREVFNTAVRNYVAANGGVLFDIADIQSHDPSSNPVVDSNGYEAMWDGYTSDGGHLNETGRQRVANAVWWLLAKATPHELPYKSYLPIVLK